MKSALDFGSGGVLSTVISLPEDPKNTGEWLWNAQTHSNVSDALLKCFDSDFKATR